MRIKKNKYTKIALAISLLLLILWGLLGTGTSLAWFKDSEPAVKNSFYIGKLELELSHKKGNDYYEVIDGETVVFDENALYEPGYTQIIYLKVKNNGDVPFDYRLAVDVYDVHTAKSVLGNEIYLPNYLRYGVIFGDSEAALNRAVAAAKAANNFPEAAGSYPLNVYSKQDELSLQPAEERYIAVIVRMPEEIGNAANFRGNDIPTVELGLNVAASQAGTL